MSIRLSFHGAASAVTGSCYLIEHARSRILVDCGLFQGTKTVRELNYRDFPFEVGSIDYVLLTHAHIDHVGLLPKLVRHGFNGPIMATEPTADLLSFILPDSGAIQQSEVERLNARNRQRARPAVEPIYTRADAERSLARLEACDYDRWFEPGPGVRVRFWNAAHILGSASLELEIEDGAGPPLHMLFSGDIGPDETSFHPEPQAPSDLDVVVMESTYGDRDRADVTVEQRRARLAEIIIPALQAGGKLLIPAFAVERSQELLFTIIDLMVRGTIPETHVFLDSPLAVRATEVFMRHPDTLHEAGDLRLLFNHRRLKLCETIEESRAIDRIKGSAIILAASGMCEAGRIRRHLKEHLWRPEATLLFVGYQAPGTLGQIIQSGERRVRLMGDEIHVKCRIETIESFSAHADQRELVAWAKARIPVHDALFLTHGEEEPIRQLRAKLAELDIDALKVHVPQLDQTFELAKGEPAKLLASKSRIEPRFAATQADWHNGYARLLLDIADELRALPDDRSRLDLLARLRRTLRA